MRQARAYTVTEDWVALNPDITHAEFRVYTLIKGNIPHGSGGVPEYGFRTTAAWVARMSNGMISTSTAHRCLQGLAKKGVLLRRNDPNRGGEGAEFEFITHPKSYDGPRSVMGEAGEVKKLATRSLAFSRVKLKGGPDVSTEEAVQRVASDLNMDDPAADEEPEFDLSGLDEIQTEEPLPLGPEEEFADELERITGSNPEEHLRLMRGSCLRVARAVRPALAAGWKPGELARRMAAELNPRIHSPEKLLLRKADDVGRPPSQVRKSREPEIPDYDPAYDFSHLDIKSDQAPEREAGSELLLGEAAQETKEQRLARIARKYSRN